ncbi:MAG: DUF58 domain-containing protein [Bradymonadaceae bacterium]
MNPHLTSNGRWLFITAMAFLLVGVIMGRPVIILLGQIPIVLLVLAYLLCLPSALALDRRRLSLNVQQVGQGPEPRSSHVVGDVIPLEVSCDNHSTARIHGFEVSPFTLAPIEMTAPPEARLIPAHQRAMSTMEVIANASGRWVLSGFDVRITDPLGLVQNKDYLPCLHVFECYPRAGRLARAPRVRADQDASHEPGLQRRARPMSSGIDIRQLRDYHPGDPLRSIAWKASARTNTLISRDFDQDVTLSTYVFLDISTSMRAGPSAGQKLEHAITLTTEFASAHLQARNRVGLMTFDEKLYAHLPPVSSTVHLGRLIHHLLGLSSIVDEDLTELDADEAERLLVDYLLVQECFDFCKGSGVDPTTGINHALLERWLTSTLPAEDRTLGSPAITEGVLNRERSPVRRFLQLRGVPLPYRVDARLGMKERGLLEAVEHLIETSRRRHQIVVISDLCAVMNLELLSRAIRLAQSRGHSWYFAVPFTPYYSDDAQDFSPRYTVVRELFTTAEIEERMRIVERLRSLGVPVEFLGPEDKVIYRSRR